MRVEGNNDDKADDRKVHQCPSVRDVNAGDEDNHAISGMVQRIRAGASPRKRTCRHKAEDPCGAERHTRRRPSAQRDGQRPCTSGRAAAENRNPCSLNRSRTRRSNRSPCASGSCENKRQPKPYDPVEDIINEGLNACRRPEQYVPRPERPACGYERDYFDDAADMRNWQEHRVKSQKPKCCRPRTGPVPHSQCLGACRPAEPEPEYNEYEQNGAMKLAEHLLAVEQLRLQLVQRIERQQNMLLTASQRRLLEQQSAGRERARSSTPGRSPSSRSSPRTPSNARQCGTPGFRTPVELQQRRSVRELVAPLLAPKRPTAPAPTSQRRRVKYVPPSPSDSDSTDENDNENCCPQSQARPYTPAAQGASSRATCATPVSTPRKRVVYQPPSMSSSSSSSCGGACGDQTPPPGHSDNVANPQRELFDNNDRSWIASDPSQRRMSGVMRMTSTPRTSDHNNQSLSRHFGLSMSSQPSSVDSPVEFYYRSATPSGLYSSQQRANDSRNCSGG